MGAWGSGLQANDPACDALVHYQHHVESETVDVQWLLDDVIVEWGWPDPVLGIADALLDRGWDLWPHRQMLMRFVEEELQEEQLLTRKDPGRRYEALERFVLRVESEPVDKEALARDNEPLGAKFGKTEPEPAGRTDWKEAAAILLARVRAWRTGA